MKKVTATLLAVLLIYLYAPAQNVGINEDGSPPDPSAILDIRSTTKGLLVPRMTTAEREAIVSPANGLIVFDTDENRFYFTASGGWIQVSSGGAGTNYWSINGTHIFKNNGGSVGIGTSNPTDLLTIQSPVHSYGFTHTDGTIKLSSFLGGGAGGAWIGTQTSHPFHIYTANAAVPNATFNTNYTTDLRGTKARLRLYDGNGIGGSLMANNVDMIINARTAGTFGVPGNIILQFDDAVNNDYAGKVGIGNATPAAKFQITGGPDFGNTEHAMRIMGANSFIDFTDYNSVSFGFIRNRNNNTTGGFSVGLEIGVTPPPAGFPDRAISFSTYHIPRMVITPSGFVGINTTNPTYPLSVNGTIRSKEVIVETGWADYVFANDYRLRPLSELEAFITEYKHLPNIPSAKEIEQQGLHVGDVQKRMMEKIEEMALYIIALKKEIDDLRAHQNK